MSLVTNALAQDFISHGIPLDDGSANLVICLTCTALPCQEAIECAGKINSSLLFPKDYPHTESTLTARTLRAITMEVYDRQLNLFKSHPTLGPRCNQLIKEQLERTPLKDQTEKPIEITSRIKSLAIKRALRNEAAIEGMDISDLSLSTKESIKTALQRIQEDPPLITFFELLLDQIESETYRALFAIEDKAAKAKSIREWISQNQEILNGITRIDARDKKLTSIPSEICYFINLQGLDLSYNKLAAIPESIGKLSQLRELDLEGNQLTAIPDNIGDLSQLRGLYLGLNQLIAIPESIGKLSQLQRLWLFENELTAIPNSIDKLSQLQTLYLTNNKLTAIPDSIDKLSQLRKLELACNELTAIPESIGKLSQLQTLLVSHNKLTAIPGSIDKLSQLQKLNLSYNKLTAIPDSIGELSQLQELELACNELTAIPESIGKLSQLQRLDLSYNELIGIPEGVRRLAIWPAKVFVGYNPIVEE